MARQLDVYFNQQLGGQLIQNDQGQMVFHYDLNYLNQPNAVALSYSLPLREEPFSRHECRGFFAGILPEAEQRKLIASKLGISARNDFALLAEIGGECAGAVTFLPVGEVPPKTNDAYYALTDQRLADILKALPRRPLMIGVEGVRLSLAGAQGKIAVHKIGNQLSVPLDSSPSTHILKPAIEHFEHIVFNEAFCMQLASMVGIPTAEVSVHQVENIDYLLIKRYDRIFDDSGTVHRLHQEDFCQALGIVPEMKYQSEGGPNFKQCFGLLKTLAARPVVDLKNLLDAVIFNYLIGNNDAHGKNFSLLYEDDFIQLAPLYDLLSTVYYPDVTKKMAMKIGKESEFEKIFPRHFDKFSELVGLSRQQVKNRLLTLTEKVIVTTTTIEVVHPSMEAIASLIKARCQFVLDRFSTK